MKDTIIEKANHGNNSARGDAMNHEQIIMLIINERLYKMGAITKEEMDKISIEIKNENAIEIAVAN